jgi:hypothetical protein
MNRVILDRRIAPPVGLPSAAETLDLLGQSGNLPFDRFGAGGVPGLASSATGSKRRVQPFDHVRGFFRSVPPRLPTHHCMSTLYFGNRSIAAVRQLIMPALVLVRNAGRISGDALFADHALGSSAGRAAAWKSLRGQPARISS